MQLTIKVLVGMMLFMLLTVTHAESYLVGPVYYIEHACQTSCQHFSRKHTANFHKYKSHHLHHLHRDDSFNTFYYSPKMSWRAYIRKTHSNYYSPDMQTGDDVAMLYPDMDIDH